MVYGFGQGVNILGPLLVMPHIISVCGESGLGKVGVGFSIALILNGIVDYGSYINGVRDISINRGNPEFIRKKFQDIYASKILLLLGVSCIFSLLVLFLPYLAKEKALYFLSLPVVVGQFLSPAWYLQGIEDFKAISFANVVSKIIYIAAVFLFISDASDYGLANFFFGMGTIIANLVLLAYVVRRTGMTFSGMNFAGGRKILKDEFSFSSSQFFLSIYQYFPIVAISYLGGDFMAGQFRIIDQIVSVFKSYLLMFFYFTYGNICYEINAAFRRGLRIWAGYNGLNFLVTAFTLFIVSCFTEELFAYFKVSDATSQNLVFYFRIGLIVPLLVSLSLPLRQLMFAFEKNRIYIRITILATCANVLVLAILTSLEGLGGALLSIILIEVVIITLYLAILSKHVLKALKPD